MTSERRRTQTLRTEIDKSAYFAQTERAGAVRYEPYNNTYWPVDYGRDQVEEYQAVAERAVLIDVGCERSVELRGPDAVRFADYLCTRDMQTIKPGRARHTVICEPNGEIYCQAMVLRVDEDIVWILHGPVNFLQWANGIEAHTDFDVQVRQTDVFPLAVQGPRSYEIMRELAPDAADMKFFRWTRTAISGVDVIVCRSGFTGAFGYEVFPFDPREAPKIWDVALAAGDSHGLLVTPMIGPYFERGVTDFRYGDRLGLNPFEARLERAVNLDAGPFVGKEALLRVQELGPVRKLVGVRFGPDADLPALEYPWPIESLAAGQESPGVISRARNSYYLKEWIGYAVVRSSVAIGTSVRVRHPRGTAEAELVELPFME